MQAIFPDRRLVQWRHVYATIALRHFTSLAGVKLNHLRDYDCLQPIVGRYIARLLSQCRPIPKWKQKSATHITDSNHASLTAEARGGLGSSTWSSSPIRSTPTADLAPGTSAWRTAMGRASVRTNLCVCETYGKSSRRDAADNRVHGQGGCCDVQIHLYRRLVRSPVR